MMVVKKLGVLFFLFVIFSGVSVRAQISPPGLSGTKFVGWGAIGFNQQLNQKMQFNIYFGGGRISDPDSWNLLQKQGILVYNQEFQYQFSKHLELLACQSYRKQKEYIEHEPFTEDDPSSRTEIRYYFRLNYKQSSRRISYKYSFRPEIRTFYGPDGSASSMPMELRFRFKTSAQFSLDESRYNVIIGANEILTAVDEYQSPAGSHHHQWSNYHYTEDRLSLYFRHLFPKPDFTIDVGAMEQFVAHKHLHPVPYLSMDIIVNNPFRHRHRES